MIPKKYLLNNGKIYWHRLYFDMVPKWMTQYAPPGGFYNYAAYAYRPHEYVKDLCLQAKWFVQRGTRGYSDCDAWNWCNHHSQVMVGVLKQLRKYKHGHPIGLTPAKWTRALTVMINGFQAAVDEENDVTSYKRLSRQECLKLVFARRRKLTLALKYFSKYYHNLWD